MSGLAAVLAGRVAPGVYRWHAAYDGRNLDALADSLSELTHPTLLLWDGWGPLARADERTFRVVLEILGTRAYALTVLLRGARPDQAGPAADVPSLD